MLGNKHDFTPAIIDIVDALIVVLDIKGRIVRFNRTCEKVTGYSFDEVKNRFFWELLLIPEEIEPVKVVFYQLKAGDFPNKHTNYWVAKNGNRRLIEWSNTVLLNDKGDVEYIVGTGIDVTERMLADEALKKSEQRYRALIDNSLDGVYISTPEGKFIYVNPALVEMLGYKSQEELLSINIKKDLYFAESERPLPSERVKPIVTRLRRKDGTEIWVEIHSRVIFDNSGNPIYYQGITRDITERRQLEEKLRYMATHDSLTGLYSRAFFEEELSRYSDKRFLPLGVMMFDVDGLKYVNDAFGHASGDEFLKTTAKILSKIFRASEILARIGGDEFAVILPNVNEIVIGSVIKRLEMQLSKENKQRDDISKIRISYGYSIREDKSIDMLEVLKYADKNLYKNKYIKKPF
ncbi:MAG: PAS domain S-box protein [Actinobacteria bacterium]|nr:PAS domain S-box protein [Actinomycetota bacterium]